MADRSWRRWGPYLAERQWGTVREDYSAGGTAWEYFPHHQAPSRAYRWGEDGLAGICDNGQRLCLSLALWNGRDPILKERLFGLTNAEGNHGEDVKELYYFLDATPRHAYLKMLYKYPQREFPYARLVEENGRRGRGDPEFELIDTGIFDDDRYFDVVVEYAKAEPNDVLVRLTVHNRGPEPAAIHVIPQLLFRNTWSWNTPRADPKPAIARVEGGFEAHHAKLGTYRLVFEGAPALLLTENETNVRRVFGVEGGPGPFKDAFHDRIVRGGALEEIATGTKAAGHVEIEVPGGGSRSVRARLFEARGARGFDDFDEVFARRIAEADAFYEGIQREVADEDARLVQRQAYAGLIWSQQFYHYDVPRWLAGDPGLPPPPEARKRGRNHEWTHVNNAEVLAMPDTWEYPWYAAWDLAFHAVAWAGIDPEFAKEQLVLLTREWYMHPNGQLPAYEWAFGDVNPPVHAWAAWRVFRIDRERRTDGGDVAFLERVFHKLMLNFTWWVNRKDAEGRNIFQGGFLGLDNIGVFDRSAPLPTGGFINQADGTSWMAMYSLDLMRIALELALRNPVYEDIATKFFEHFLQIAEALSTMGEGSAGLWDDEDGFFYDVLSLPGGARRPLKVRSMVGLIPLFAVEVLDPELLEAVPAFKKRLEWYLRYRPDLAALVSHWEVPGKGERRLLSLLRGHRMKRLLRRALDESEFLSDHGVRSLSRYHRDHPYEFDGPGGALTLSYQPAESTSGLFGGNSNWRGPVWLPVNYLLVESLREFHHYYGDDFKIECPVGSGRMMTIAEAADELSRRLSRLFVRDGEGRRAVLRGHPKTQSDPHFRDLILFHEYFDGDTGRGLGASHQTGWTALIAALLRVR